MLAVFFENAYITARQYIRYLEISTKLFRSLAVRLRETRNVHHFPAPIRQQPVRNEDRVININNWTFGINKTTVYIIYMKWWWKQTSPADWIIS